MSFELKYFYVDEDNKPQGPFSAANLRLFLKSGIIHPMTIIQLKEGSSMYYHELEAKLDPDKNSAETPALVAIISGVLCWIACPGIMGIVAISFGVKGL